MNKINKNILLISLVLAIVISTIHTIALNLFLYFEFWWLDIVMHFLGGLLISLVFLWIYTRFGFYEKTKSDSSKCAKCKIITLMFVSILIIGLAWEIFEITTQITLVDLENYRIDTLSDFIMSLIGGLSGYLYFSVSEKKIQKTLLDNIKKENV